MSVVYTKVYDYEIYLIPRYRVPLTTRVFDVQIGFIHSYRRITTKVYGGGADVGGVIWNPGSQYLMAGWDTVGSRWVSWQTSNQYAYPSVTIPPALGTVDKIRIVHAIDMQDLKFYAYPGSKSLTESVATGIVEIPIESNSVLSATLQYTVNADDGTDFQVLTGEVLITAANKNGTITVSTPGNMGSENVSCSSGTLTNSVTVSTGTNKITVNLNAVSSLTQTTLKASWRVWWNGSATEVTPL